MLEHNDDAQLVRTSRQCSKQLQLQVMGKQRNTTTGKQTLPPEISVPISGRLQMLPGNDYAAHVTLRIICCCIKCTSRG
jgi:hypothetical protein